MLDMLIQGGRVVTPAGAGDWDVGIAGEKIVAVAFPGLLSGGATQVIDARGKIVVPGGIETHAHAVANVQPGARRSRTKCGASLADVWPVAYPMAAEVS